MASRPSSSAGLNPVRQLLADGNLPQAEAHCRQWLRRNRRDASGLDLLAQILTGMGRFDEAIRTYQEGLRAAPRSASILCGIARLRTAQGDYREALSRYEQVLQRDPRNLEALAGKARLLQRERKHDEARALVEPAAGENPGNVELVMVYAAALQGSGEHEQARRVLEARRAAGGLTEPAERALLFALARSLDRLGAYDEAFACVEAAHARAAPAFDIARQRDFFDRIRRVFTAERTPDLVRSGNDSELPIFIVGMPRSGSTLVEQIIQAHPEAYGAGEVDFIFNLAHELPRGHGGQGYPEVVTRLDRSALDRLATQYLKQLRRLDRRSDRIVDKNLMNFIPLGLIAMMLPKARVIHCRRDALDTCLSCYLEPLLPSAHPYTNDLRDLGLYFRAYDELMGHWRQVLDVPLLAVQYEDLVAEPEPRIRELLEFCGLEWDEACLRPHESKRTVATLSYDQVARPIYRSSVKRHEHYAAHLAPLREALRG